ncbi:putative enoyl-CoA hydratase, mitochondrial [Wickerhamomyces ciferrii]|uniref:Probable enoyl-CoA hydratase, mitochondrial n=1 Tax=Wickerhamomyces ciferrii (strain ATCC 14091 / BCRC 22168 / CBS 111 / JCM 3599 / NBRC 0793 / NRRL Y-1031 F-60-10) TaxID=1206466 RepID=K0KEZ4_WICCF|nr:putative enoyl-CoA hydratase, mitochondrial [Wickerhamomyces ciferrii]CCH40762.1 putative enoyl-CoA hydratase, mitochondrial [Wickerhamomyces ciferrii]
MTFKHIITSTPRTGVFQITLNRPKALNALNSALFTEILTALRKADSDIDQYGAVVITGGDRVFAAGADIKEMLPIDSAQAMSQDMLSNWKDFNSIGIPIIAAVEGYALGGGCELAMNCDIIYASNKAVFGQPEVKLGVIPGGGGTQRLIRAIGKSRAMEYIITGDNFSSIQAEQWGLVSKNFEPKTVIKNALDLAEKIAKGPRLTSRSCKKAINIANETNLQNGLDFERNIFHSLFGNYEQKEGMNAFVEKRKPKWSKL